MRRGMIECQTRHFCGDNERNVTFEDSAGWRDFDGDNAQNKW